MTAIDREVEYYTVFYNDLTHAMEALHNVRSVWDDDYAEVVSKIAKYFIYKKIDLRFKPRILLHYFETYGITPKYHYG